MINKAWGQCKKIFSECRACRRRQVPIRETHIGNLCFVCWVTAKTCPKCGDKIMGGNCDECGMEEMRKNAILSSSTAGFMADHAIGYKAGPDEPKIKGERRRQVRKTDRHIVKSKPTKGRKRVRQPDA